MRRRQFVTTVSAAGLGLAARRAMRFWQRDYAPGWAPVV